jgi:hypothetical protein
VSSTRPSKTWGKRVKAKGIGKESCARSSPSV